jgi:2-polyprenyl-3-methyl-5-hydroxy-6-metoxy-1,4-benzoquinol methylase
MSSGSSADPREIGYWNDHWDHRDAERLRVQCRALPVRRLREAVAAALPERCQRAIELGAGGSAWLELMAGKSSWVAGVDLSVPGLLLTRRYGKLTGSEAPLIRGDVMALPFTPGSFDAVFSGGLVEHFEKPEELIGKAAALLRPEGICITSVPNKRGMPGMLDKWLHPESFAGHVRFTTDQLAEAHRLAGLEVLSAGYVGSFSLGARAPRSGPLRFPYRLLRKVLTTVVWGLMNLLGWYPEGRTWSPAILVVARKPAAGQKDSTL